MFPGASEIESSADRQMCIRHGAQRWSASCRTRSSGSFARATARRSPSNDGHGTRRLLVGGGGLGELILTRHRRSSVTRRAPRLTPVPKVAPLAVFVDLAVGQAHNRSSREREPAAIGGAWAPAGASEIKKGNQQCGSNVCSRSRRSRRVSSPALELRRRRSRRRRQKLPPSNRSWRDDEPAPRAGSRSTPARASPPRRLARPGKPAR